MMLWQIHSSYFCAGLVTEQRRVVLAAPIIGYMKGWGLAKVDDYCTQKGWSVSYVDRTGGGGNVKGSPPDDPPAD